MFLIPSIRSLAFKYWAKLVSIIILLGKIMPSYSRYIERRLLYIIIVALFSYQPSSCTECTRVNMWASYNIHLVSDMEYIFFTRLINF